MKKLNLKIVGVVSVTIVAVIITFVLASSPTIATGQSTVKEIQRVEEVDLGPQGTMLIPVYDLNNAGRNALLTEVTASIKLSEPSNLPSETLLSQVKLHADGDLAVLAYTNPHLTRISGYLQDVQLVIIAQRDGTSLESFEEFLATKNKQQKLTVIDKEGKEHTENIVTHWIAVNRSMSVSVGGVQGYGYEPLYTPVHDNGEVQWWSKDGIHYQVIANLPLQDLINIAESIQLD